LSNLSQAKAVKLKVLETSSFRNYLKM